MTATHAEILGDTSNDADELISLTAPYTVTVSVTGSSALLFHRWSCESVKAKAEAGKNSAAKKTDDVESYVWRNDANEICIPGEYFRQSMINPQKGAARSWPDPRSPRKSAIDLFAAAVMTLTDLAPLGPDPRTEWDYLDRRRVTVQRNGVTRERPAFTAGWTAEFQLLVIAPEYISPDWLHACLTRAGQMVGVGDFRPTFGRYRIDKFDVGLSS